MVFQELRFRALFAKIRARNAVANEQQGEGFGFGRGCVCVGSADCRFGIRQEAHASSIGYEKGQSYLRDKKVDSHNHVSNIVARVVV